jgi:hypothetical protein
VEWNRVRTNAPHHSPGLHHGVALIVTNKITVSVEVLQSTM